MSYLYLIRDDRCRVMHIDGLQMFGVKTSIPAIFFSEQEALDVLFAIESSGTTTVPHTVSKVEDSFEAVDDD